MSLLRTPSPGAQIAFLEFQQPALESGTYKVEVEQRLESPKTGPQTFTKRLTFVVTGERFGPLAPKDIAAVFPPADSVGEHANVLPHIALRRSTLPWERLPGETDENRSWLALLLFRESDFEDGADKPRVATLKLSDLLATPVSTARFPTLELEPGQQAEDEVTVIDVQRKTLEPLLPTYAELALLAHAHQRKTASGAPEGDVEATVISKRLPEPGGESTVYLVSLEKRYKNGAFDFSGAGPNDWIRLVTLTSWTFHSVDPEQGFAALLRNLDLAPSVVLRLPPSVPEGSPAAPYLEQGYVPLPHWMRRGSKSVSFYRGPLVPGENADSVSSLLPAQSADQLMRYDPATGLFDVSYAAAWELGRLMTLANTGVALELANWNRQSAQQATAARQRAARRLPLRRQREEETKAPEAVATWLRDLGHLRGLPFSYLVPDERVLPVEGLRFVWLDPVWVDCLLDGARSMGRLTEADREFERARRARRALGQNPPKVSGFVMRSSVVSGWPKLLVEAYRTQVPELELPDPADVLPQFRVERLADDVLLGLFEGEIKTLDVFQAPEAMQFGLDEPNGDPPEFSKNLRDPSGGSLTEVIKPIPWSDEGKGVVDVARLAAEMKDKLKLGSFTAAQVALQMIEGVPRIRFVAAG